MDWIVLESSSLSACRGNYKVFGKFPNLLIFFIIIFESQLPRSVPVLCLRHARSGPLPVVGARSVRMPASHPCGQGALSGRPGQGQKTQFIWVNQETLNYLSSLTPVPYSSVQITGLFLYR